MQEQIQAVQRMQDYVHNHLSERITLADLARVSYFSPWYAHRLFVRWTNLTPFEYIRRLRLSRSALKLRDEGCGIAQVAFSLGFGSVDGYQRAFHREFGCNPSDYAASPIPLHLFTPYGVIYRTPRKEKDMAEVKQVLIQLVERPRRKLIFKRGVKAQDYLSYCEEVGCDVWGLLTSIRSICGEPVSLWLPKEYILPGTSKYVQGVEVAIDYDGIVPEGFDVVELPAAKYLLFQGEPFEEEDYHLAIHEIWKAIERYQPSAIGYEWDDGNPRIQLEPIGARGYMELVPVR